MAGISEVVLIRTFMLGTLDSIVTVEIRGGSGALAEATQKG